MQCLCENTDLYTVIPYLLWVCMAYKKMNSILKGHWNEGALGFIISVKILKNERNKCSEHNTDIHIRKFANGQKARDAWYKSITANNSMIQIKLKKI